MGGTPVGRKAPPASSTIELVGGVLDTAVRDQERTGEEGEPDSHH